MFNYSSVFLLNSCFFTFILRAEIVTSAEFLKILSIAVENRLEQILKKTQEQLKTAPEGILRLSNTLCGIRYCRHGCRKNMKGSNFGKGNR